MDTYCGSAKQWEFILIDDASTDATGALVTEYAARDAKIVALRHERVAGQTGCFRSGFRSARGTFVVTIDGDLQVFPEDIPLLLDKTEDGAVFVNAIRTKRKDHPLLTAGSYVFSRAQDLVFQTNLTDVASNFSVIQTRLVRDLPLVANDHRYLGAILASLGERKFAEVRVRHERRRTGISKYKLRKMIAAVPEFARFYQRISSGYYQLGISPAPSST